jgi:hypothetical protein
MFRLKDQEARILRSQIATSSSRAWGGRRYAPYVFTEHGAIMAATILNSPRATELSVYIVRAFVRMRELASTGKDLGVKFEALAELAKAGRARTRRRSRFVYASCRRPVARSGARRRTALSGEVQLSGRLRSSAKPVHRTSDRGMSRPARVGGSTGRPPERSAHRSSSMAHEKRQRRRYARLLGWGAMLCLVLPIVASMGCTMLTGPGSDWRTARRDSSGQAPDPASTHEAVLQVYAARTVGWKGTVGVHTWIALKPAGAAEYKRYEVVGWGVMRGRPAIQIDRSGPDNYWFGAAPELLLDRRGPEVDAWIPRIEAAVASYPYPDFYRTWPGPNSNTFVAHIARAVPEMRLDLPPTAIGKDYLPGGALLASAPSGTGYQASLFGLLGVMVAREEGLEFNLLGLSFGIDLNSPAIKLPGIGRLGFPRN